MENNFQVNHVSQCDPTSQCIIAKKVCDLCTQRDCLSPIESENSRLVDPARSCEENKIRIDNNPALVFDPGDIIQVPLNANIVRLAGKFTVSECKILSIEPVGGCGISRQGYWKVTIRFKFCYPIKLFRGDVEVPLEEEVGGSFVPKSSICACTIFQKTVVLFGGQVCKCDDNTVDIAFCNSLYDPCGPYSNEKPFALVQSEACLLQLELGQGPGVSPTTQVINATIGLFAIIKTYRIVNMLVQTNGDCLIEEEPCQDISDDPCEFFNSLDFPFKDFDPACPAPLE
ncbi:hypothetical protein [Clostridium sp. ZS2-4]|uniref:hypothetical protein n=1 Tax=Clostridium sp. ZS2-4 TaxID=2987703 RepID=UPI00227AFB0A|nr:hypothetical protein [Clostridium sp. ZS2-4]MCY6356387.1 hypothetical protein [Clostridium sp. ZS2-4]